MWVEHCGLAWDDLDREGTKEYRLEVSLGQGDREEPAGLIGDAFTSKALDADNLIYSGQLNNDNFERIALDHVASLSRLGDSSSMRCLKNMHADITRRVDDAERASRVRTRMGGVPAAPLAQLKTLKPLRKAVFEAVARARHRLVELLARRIRATRKFHPGGGVFDAERSFCLDGVAVDGHHEGFAHGIGEGGLAHGCSRAKS